MSPVGQINVAARSVSRADRASSQRGPRTPAGNVNDARRSKSAAERRYRQRTKRTLVPARLQESAQVPTAPRPGRRKTPRVDCAGCRRDRRHRRIRQRKTATRSPVAQGGHAWSRLLAVRWRCRNPYPRGTAACASPACHDSPVACAAAPNRAADRRTPTGPKDCCAHGAPRPNG